MKKKKTTETNNGGGRSRRIGDGDGDDENKMGSTALIRLEYEDRNIYAMFLERE